MGRRLFGGCKQRRLKTDARGAAPHAIRRSCQTHARRVPSREAAVTNELYRPGAEAILVRVLAAARAAREQRVVGLSLEAAARQRGVHDGFGVAVVVRPPAAVVAHDRAVPPLQLQDVTSEHVGDHEDAFSSGLFERAGGA